LAYLYYVAQGMTYFQISMLLGIGVMTACKIVHECTYTVCKHMYSTYIRFPTIMKARQNMLKWKQQTTIPGIYGAIDGIQIDINKPYEYGEDYFNHKSNYSINV
jgi:hypothetical protein